MRQLISFTLTSPPKVVLVDSLVLCSDAAELWIFLPAVPRASLRVCPGKHGGYMYYGTQTARPLKGGSKPTAEVVRPRS